MENIIVGGIVAAAFVYVVKGLVKTFKGEGGCSCASACSGCSENDGPCGHDGQFMK